MNIKSTPSHLEVFSRKDVVVVFTYAPAGLGHLRVTDALYEGLPEEAQTLLVGSDDEFIQRIHRLSSVSVALRRVMEWVQHGWRETVFTKFYRAQLQRYDQDLYQRFTHILEHRIEMPKVILIVASHFGLAHQLGSFKQKLEEKFGVKILVLVIVTDDSPQQIWYVPGVDRIFVPSHLTKKELQNIGTNSNLSKVEFEVNSYPISPKLAVNLSRLEVKNRQAQLSPSSSRRIETVIPISGAAVGMDYYKRLVEKMKKQSPRYRFHIVARDSLHTAKFLGQMRRKSGVEIYNSTRDREVVDLYQDVYLNRVIGLEITKPSEQAFKALYSTKQIGGSVLLFSQPVGRQEYDNLDFMRRHELIPDQETNQLLWSWSIKKLEIKDYVDGPALLEKSRHWRGVMIPDQSREAANFIQWLLDQKVLSQMGEAHHVLAKDKLAATELSPEGVGRFWELTADLVHREIK